MKENDITWMCTLGHAQTRTSIQWNKPVRAHTCDVMRIASAAHFPANVAEIFCNVAYIAKNTRF